MGIKRNGRIRCNRCGRCCYAEFEGQLKRCKYLIDLPYGKTKCAIYEKRLGVKTGIGNHICMERVKVKKHYKGCPYNHLIIKPIHLNTQLS